MTGPQIWSGESDDLPPMFQIGNDLESLWHFSTSIPCEYLSNFTIDPLDFRIINRLLIGLLEFLLQHSLPLILTLTAIQPEKIHEIDLSINSIALLQLRRCHLDHLIIFVLFQLPPNNSSLLFLGIPVDLLPGDGSVHLGDSLANSVPLG